MIKVASFDTSIWSKAIQNCDFSEVPWYTSEYRDEGGNPSLRVWKIHGGNYFYFRYSDQTIFVIDSHGTEIWIHWSEELGFENAATYLLGPVLGFVLRLRGVICLHASAVVIQGKVALFVGEAGAGKSTTLATFSQHGYPVLADDVVALTDQGDKFFVQPAYPRIRLWQESVKALYGSVDALPQIVQRHPTWNKQYLDLIQEGYCFQQEPLPIGVIYLLNRRANELAAPFIESLPTKEKLLLLVANTYTNYLLSKSMRANEFDVLGRLVKYLPLKRVTPHSSLLRLPHLLELIQQDFQLTCLEQPFISDA